MISRLDHVSIAVSDYDRARRFFQDILGVIPGASGSDGRLNYFWEILSVGDLSRMELLRPTGTGGLLDKFLEKKSGGVHHLTFETSDIRAAKTRLEELGVPYFGYTDRSPDWKELFIHPRDTFGVLIQIAEFRPDEWIHPSLGLSGRKWRTSRTDGGARLTVSHPGGGTADVELSRREIRNLISDLKALL